MSEQSWLARQFEENRKHLKSVALRMLGSDTEADDAVQEAWIRLDRTGGGQIENLGGWLTTVVARVCLDQLRSRRANREVSWDEGEQGQLSDGGWTDPEEEALLADAMGPALLAVLETLSPPERVAFVLHDLFGVPFDDVGAVVERSSEAARQLASRARRRLRGVAEPESVYPRRAREVVEAFLAAARGGNFEALLTLLDPEVSVSGDATAAAMGGTARIQGREAAAKLFGGRARGARLALVDGQIAASGIHNGTPVIVLLFTIRDGMIVHVDVVADRDHLAAMVIEPLE
jgi:RNA polymerase sigma-70 factor (ECF subfamily)